MEISMLRSLFPAFENGWCFLDWAATGIAPERTRVRVQEYVQTLTGGAPESTWMHGEHGETRARVRRQVADLIGSAAEDIALVESTTAGLNVFAQTLRLEPGDQVVLGGADYLAVSTPWRWWEERHGVELVFVPNRAEVLLAADLLAACGPRTRVVAVSSIGWTTGALLDLEELAPALRGRGIHLVLDGIQTFGVVPLDVRRTPVSALAVGGHKWLGSTLGAGFLYVDPTVAEAMERPLTGFLSGRSEAGPWWQRFQDPTAGPHERAQFPPRGRSFETGGTPSYPGAIGLEVALDWIGSVGPASIAAHVRELGTALIRGLKARGLAVLTPEDPGQRGGIIVFEPEGGAPAALAWQQELTRRRIVVSVRYAAGLGGVRVSLHGPNGLEDVDRLLDAVDDVRRELAVPAPP